MIPTRKPLLTRRRVITGTVLLVLVLAVAGLGFWGGDAAAPVKATFVRFEKSDERASTVAVIRLTNEANQAFQFHPNGRGTASGRFVSRGAKGDLVWMPGRVHSVSLPALLAKTNWMTMSAGTTLFQSVILPHSEVTQRIPLPEDGRIGRVAVLCLPTTRSLPGILKFARPLWWKLNRSRLKEFWPECDEEIKCPLMRPDGLVEPPWLVSKGELKAP